MFNMPKINSAIRRTPNNDLVNQLKYMIVKTKLPNTQVDLLKMYKNQISEDMLQNLLKAKPAWLPMVVTQYAVTNRDTNCFLIDSSIIIDELIEEGKKIVDRMDSIEFLDGNSGILHLETKNAWGLSGLSYAFTESTIAVCGQQTSGNILVFISGRRLVDIEYMIIALVVLQNFSTSAKPVDGVWRLPEYAKKLPTPSYVSGLRREAKNRRSWHFRQLRSERYYRNEWANSPRGSRWIICGADSNDGDSALRDLTSPKTVISTTNSSGKLQVFSNAYMESLV